MKKEPFYVSESGTKYTKKQFLEICFGKPELMEVVKALCEWQHPETVIEELIREEEIDEHGNFIKQKA